MEMDLLVLQGNSLHLFQSDEEKRVIKTYGKMSVVAMLNEYKQFHNLDVFGLQYTTTMSG